MSERDNKLYYELVKRKDTKGDFYFLRRDSVDVMRYLPRFLAKDPEFLKIQNALSWEHEHLRLKLQDVARQFYIETATWGLSSWERIYEVTPPKGADYSLRRALVKAKMLGTGVMTVEAIKHLVNPFLFQPDADIDELPFPGMFRVLIHSGTDYMPEIRRALAIMAPAHLVYKFGFIIHDLEDNPGENVSDGLSGVINYGYEDIYPYFNVPFRHDGFPFHEGAFRHSGFFLRNGEMLHSGVPCSAFQRQSFSVNIDELTLNAKIILYDDTTTLDDDDRRNMYYIHNGVLFHGGALRREGVVLHSGTEQRNGSALYNGLYPHGSSVLPIDARERIDIRQVFTETPTVADKGGQMQMRINTLHVGGVRRDGRAKRDMSEFTNPLDGGFSVIRKGRSGYYARDGDNERSHDTMAVAL